MLSRLTILVLAVTTTGLNADADTKLQWNSHYDNAKKVARTESRPLVVVIEDAAQEQVCELDSKSTDALLEGNFELVKIDVNTKYGRKVADAFGAKQLPYTIVSNHNSSEIVYRKSGRMTGSDWTNAINKSLKSTASKLSWSTQYDVAKEAATQAKRPLLVVIEKTTADVNLDKTTKNFLVEKDFELVKIDANTDYGQKVAKAFGAKKFPYTIVTKSDASEIVFRRAGQMSKRDWKTAFAKCFNTKIETPAKRRSVIVMDEPVKETRIVAAPATKVVTKPVALVSMVQPIVPAQFTSAPMFNSNFGSYGMAKSHCSASS